MLVTKTEKCCFIIFLLFGGISIGVFDLLENHHLLNVGTTWKYSVGFAGIFVLYFTSYLARLIVYKYFFLGAFELSLVDEIICSHSQALDKPNCKTLSKQRCKEALIQYNLNDDDEIQEEKKELTYSDKVIIIFGGNNSKVKSTFDRYSQYAEKHNYDVIVVDYLKRIWRLSVEGQLYGMEDITEFGKTVLETAAEKYHGIKNCFVIGESAGGVVALNAIEAYKKAHQEEGYPYLCCIRTLSELFYFKSAFKTVRWCMKQIYNFFSSKKHKWSNSAHIYQNIPANQRMLISVKNDNVISTNSKIENDIPRNDKTVFIFKYIKTENSTRDEKSHSAPLSNLFDSNHKTADSMLNDYVDYFANDKTFSRDQFVSVQSISYFMLILQIFFASIFFSIYFPLYIIRKWKTFNRNRKIFTIFWLITTLMMKLGAWGMIDSSTISNSLKPHFTFSLLDKILVLGVIFFMDLMYNILQERIFNSKKELKLDDSSQEEKIILDPR